VRFVDLVRGRVENDWRRGNRRIVADLMGELDATHRRHHQIGDDEIGMP
jgi:hypothetical protein